MDKVTVYRVGEINNNTMFFADSLRYFEHSATGYKAQDARKYTLNLSNAKVWNPINELQLSMESWETIWGEVETFEKYKIGYEYADGAEDDTKYAITDTDLLADAGRRLGYDVTIFEDVPNNYRQRFTEYAVHNPHIIEGR